MTTIKERLYYLFEQAATPSEIILCELWSTQKLEDISNDDPDIQLAGLLSVQPREQLLQLGTLYYHLSYRLLRVHVEPAGSRDDPTEDWKEVPPWHIENRKDMTALPEYLKAQLASLAW